MFLTGQINPNLKTVLCLDFQLFKPIYFLFIQLELYFLLLAIKIVLTERDRLACEGRRKYLREEGFRSPGTKKRRSLTVGEEQGSHTPLGGSAPMSWQGPRAVEWWPRKVAPCLGLGEIPAAKNIPSFCKWGTTISRQHSALKGPCKRDTSHLYRGHYRQVTEGPQNVGVAQAL